MWKTILAVIVAASASFSMGAFANQIIVQNIQSLAGNHVLVPPPELHIVSSVWNINGTTSAVTGVTLNVTTVNGPAGITKLYQIFVQVSCLDSTGRELTCATGSATITLPANAGKGTLIVPVSPAIDPETIEVHDLSFIVTGSPTCVGVAPGFTLTANPTFLILTTASPNATVTKTLTSICGFSGTVALTATFSNCIVCQGRVSLSSSSVTLTPGSSATVTETISPRGLPTLNVFLTNTATSGPITQSVNILILVE